MPDPEKLTPVLFQDALQNLRARDPDLSMIIERYGVPPFWQRPQGFATLIHIILEQQVSLASARATLSKLRSHLETLDPAGFLAIPSDKLRSIGFSRQKLDYCRSLAKAISEGELNLDSLQGLSDEEVSANLQKLKGIGRWTVDIYLLIALLRTDVWPIGDMALVGALKDLKNLRHPVNSGDLIRLGDAWRPWRSVATRLLWFYYLRSRNRIADIYPQ